LSERCKTDNLKLLVVLRGHSCTEDERKLGICRCPFTKQFTRFWILSKYAAAEATLHTYGLTCYTVPQSEELRRSLVAGPPPSAVIMG
jgi:hypothetical protein